MLYFLKKMTRSSKTLICLSIGILLGLVLPDFYLSICELLAVSYLKVTKFIAISLIIFSILVSLYGENPNKIQKQIKKILILFISFTLLIYCFSYTFSQIFTSSLFPLTFSTSNYFPDHSSITKQVILFFTSFSSITYPAIALATILFGLALIGRNHEKEKFEEILLTVQSTLDKIFDWSLKLFPLFTIPFSINIVSTLNQNTFIYLKFYLLAFFLLCSFFIFFLFPQLLKLFCGIKKRKFFSVFSFPILVSFVSGSAIIALPLIMNCLNKLELKKNENTNPHHNKWMIGFLICLPSFGSMLSSFYVLFLGKFYHVGIPFFRHVEIIILGTFSLFNNHLLPTNGISFLIDRLSLPLDGNSLYLQSLSYTSHLSSLFSLVGLTSLTILCMPYTKKFASLKFSRVCYTLFLPVLLSTFLILSLRTYLPELPAEKPLSKTYIIASNIDVKLNKNLYTESHDRYFTNSPEEIKQKGWLRVGYLPFIPPFSFPDGKGKQVGLDISMAYKLAESLGVSLKLVPYDLQDLEKLLKEGYVDVIMSGLAISPARLNSLAFTNPYHLVDNALLVLDSKRKLFEEYKQIRNIKGLKIAVLKNSSLDEQFSKFFPNAQKFLLNHVNEFVQKEQIDAMFWKYEQAVVFSLENPQFTTIIPKPSIGKELYAYITHPDAKPLLNYLNDWLDILQLDETLKREKDMWFNLQLKEEPTRWKLF
jgi:Na+/H+-dicarboxylate symporter/ABC-type amino acid transport substrate-binding protein